MARDNNRLCLGSVLYSDLLIHLWNFSWFFKKKYEYITVKDKPDLDMLWKTFLTHVFGTKALKELFLHHSSACTRQDQYSLFLAL